MTAPTLRCAIYTRVSSDSGLEQDFNSLDAQRESAEAYIKSQAHEGWRLVRDHFDDGGFSGGSTDRPALLKLLEKIREHRIDVVVVYKVDRLTRSLADFAKLVELFDAHKVSFVSVTQSFNTTSSMGRLTLNVLLSFAQFEREVTGERIRDKIAASKKKGIWMGGVVPFGYRLEDRKLLVDDEEAAIVRLIFDLYLQGGSIPAVQRELRARGIRSRSRTSTSGRRSGGVFFTNGPISHILGNRHYIGELNHKDKSWPGEHAPIIDAAVFDSVQQKLASRRRRKTDYIVPSGARLLGKLFNEAGERMSPTYAIKKGVRYHYYVAVSLNQAQRNNPSAIGRVPAIAVETTIAAAIRNRLNKSLDPNREAEQSADDQNDDEHSNDDLISRHLERATLRARSIEIVLRDRSDPDSATDVLIVPWAKSSSQRHREILEPATPTEHRQPIRVDEQARLVRAIATARKWVDQLINGEIADTNALAIREVCAAVTKLATGAARFATAAE